MPDPNLLARYALYTILLGGLLAIVGYMYPGSDTKAQEIFQIAMVLASGANGFMAGHTAAKWQQQNNQNPTTAAESGEENPK
jgi:hypothetical protein